LDRRGALAFFGFLRPVKRPKRVSINSKEVLYG
jgi:hypothetical protein